MINTIIFDLGGVLIDWDPVHPFINVFGGDQAKAGWFIKHICNHEWNAQLDAGKSFGEAVYERANEFPEFKNEIEMYQTLWVEMLNGEITDTVHILKEIHAKNQQRLLSITNWSAETFPIAREKYNFLKLFEDIAVSGELKMIKPHPEIFEYMIRKHDLNTEKTIFIDDNAKNIQTSEKLGMRGILFKNSNLLKTELTKLGIEFS